MRTQRKLNLEWVLKDLLDDALISQAQYDDLVGKAGAHRRKNIPPLVSVAEMHWLSATRPSYPLGLERLTRWLAQRCGMDYMHIDPLRVDFASLTSLISYAYAARFNILPVEKGPEGLVIATCEPHVVEWQEELERVLNQKIRRVLVNPLDLSRYLHEFYSLQHSIQGAKDDHKITTPSKLHNFEQLLELGKRDSGESGGEPDAADQHIVHIVDWLLRYAFDQRASDIHLEPRREKGNIRLRIDGVLHLVHEVPTPIMAAMVSRFKMLGRMNLAERRRPQDGRIKTRIPDTSKEVELRLSTMPTAFGEKLVTRIFDPEVLVKDFAGLGFSPHEIEQWRRLLGQPHGIILVTGPTGSGKTSTLYSTLKYLACPEINICTIEDPIEIVDPEFNQMQVNPAIDLNFADGVRTLLRQDPDIIMVGEVRDRETAEVSIQAALTGHLVFSTLHTNDAPSSITRLLDIGVPAYLVNAALLGVLAQRLVRVLCPHCKQAAPVDKVQWEGLVAPFKLRPPPQIYLPVGCDACRQTGFKGRIGLFEMMLMDPELERMVNRAASLEEVRRHAMKNGLRPLRISGAQKIHAGLTTLEEVLGVAAVPDKIAPVAPPEAG